MTAALTPLRGSRVRWYTLVGLLLVPLTVAGVFLWGLWNPSERLEQITAAVVNEDEPVEVDGQLVPLGRVLAAELIAGEADTNFTWVLTNADDAESGLDDGRYATSITIPKNFSAAATSLAGGPDQAERATIRIAESDRGRLLDTALSSIVTQTATRVLNQQLGEQFVGNVFVGMSTLHGGISEAARGAHQLADGGDQLADGMRGLADGAQQLATGTGELAGGAQQLATGASGLVGGAQELASGTRASANGGAQLADGVESYTGMVNMVLDSVIGVSGEALEPLRQLRGIIAELPAEVFPPEATQAYLLEVLDAAIAELEHAASGNDESALVQLRNGGVELAQGARASADGQAALASGLEEYAAGVGSFAGGVSTFSDGVSQLAAQTPELASGADQLATGAAASADGALELAQGLDTAARGIPNYSESEREVMAQTAVESIEAEGESDELFNASGVPLFAGIALWAGALAAFLVLSPLWSRARVAARGIFAITVRSAIPAVVLGATQGALAGIVLPIALGYDFAKGAAFFGLAVLAGIAFALTVQGLSARFGGFGRFLAFALLVIAFAVGIVSTVPSLLVAIGDASPIGAAFDGFQAIAMGASGAGVAAAVLALWGGLGLVLTAWAVVRERRATAGE